MIFSLKLKARLRPKAVALLSIVLIIGGIAGVTMAATAFIVSRDVQLATRLEESTVAYHASSGGIELGLLYQKFNRDIQLGADCTDANDPLCKTITEDSQPIRIYLDRLGCSKQELEEGTCSSMPPDPTDPTKHKKIIYADRPAGSGLYWMAVLNPTQTAYLPADEHVVDLKIWYMGEKLGNPDFFENIDQKLIQNDPIEPESTDYRILEQDQPISISLDKQKEYILYWHPIYEKDGKRYLWNDVDFNKAREYQNCIPDKWKGLMTTAEKNKRKQGGTNFGCGINLNQYWSSSYSSGLDAKDNIEAGYGSSDRGGNKIWPLQKLKAAIRFKPINTDVVYAVGPEKGSEGALIDTFVTHIESTGYYGNTQRKQEARIDRQKNQLLGIFDYAIFSGGKLIKSRP